MKLCPKEFEAMQSGWRKWYIREIELKTFKKFGLWIKDRDILEVGCGSGYAASLITAEAPRSYTGLDIMPEQLALARERKLENARFVEGSADDLSAFPDGSFDAALDFCILHHVELWRTFFDESRRVLRDGGTAAASISRTSREAASTLSTRCCAGTTPRRSCSALRSWSARPTAAAFAP